MYDLFSALEDEFDIELGIEEIIGVNTAEDSKISQFKT